jgi:hypothetical protein
MEPSLPTVPITDSMFADCMELIIPASYTAITAKH